MDLIFFNASEVGFDITVTERFDDTTRERPAMFLPPHKQDVIKVDPDYKYTIGINTRAE